MDLRQEAALSVQAQHRFNPLHGTLSAFPCVLSTMGGHSNVDHVIQKNLDGTGDRLAEYRRMMKQRRNGIVPRKRAVIDGTCPVSLGDVDNGSIAMPMLQERLRNQLLRDM